MSNFEQEFKRLNKAQRQAVDAIEGPVLVIAGPGTGKTQLLSMRVANILRKTDVNASNILCLTFTESGQQAVQRRLLELIGEAANNVSVHTFHSLGAAIITANTDYFYDTQQSRAADDLTIFELFYELFEHLPHGGPLSSQNGDEFLFLKDAQQRISQLKTAGISPQELRQLLANDRQWCQQANPLIQDTYQQFGRFQKKYLPQLAQLARDLHQLKVIDGSLGGVHPIAHDFLDELDNAITESETSGSTTPITTWKARWLEPTHDQLQLKTVSQHARLEILANIYEQYEAALRQKHLFDYDDMILEVLQVLSAQPDLLANLQEQFQYLLVDEYQDTNGAQARFLEFLADNPVHEGQPNFMVVGDDDQAIYGFQGADSNVMLRFRERWRDVKTIVLTDNYRSSQAILDTARQLIIQSQTRLENYYPDIVKRLAARTDPASDKPRLVLTAAEADHYRWLTDEICRLLKQGIAPETIAVIAPRHKYISRLLPYLVEANVALSYERQANILQEPTVERLLKLAKLIDALTHNHQNEVQSLLPEVLSYDWWNIPTLSLWQLSLDASIDNHSLWLDRMLVSQETSLQAAAQWLTTTAEAAKIEPLDTLLQTLVEQLTLSNKNDGLIVNLGIIEHSLSQYRPNQSYNLHDFVQYVSLHQKANLPIKVKQLTLTGQHAVQLMTAHKAKGQEFDHIFLMNVTEHIWLAEKGRLNKIGLPANFLTIQPAGETTDDKLRVLYVAATRARRQLTFVSFNQAENSKSHSLLSWLDVPNVQKTLTVKEVPDSSAARPTTENIPDWRHQHQLNLGQPQSQEWLRPYLRHYHLSPTHLTTFLNVERGGPQQFLVRHLLQFPEMVTSNMLFGNALHQTLEHAQQILTRTGKLPTTTKLIRFFETTLTQYNLRPLELQKLVERGQRTLTYYLEQRGDSFSPNNLAEQDFRRDDIKLGDVRLTGKIDRLSVDKTTHTAIISDFKTGKAFTKWQTSASYNKHKLHRYEQQLLFYKLLVENSAKFDDYQVTHAVLEFVEPDKWNRVSHLSYHYEKATEDRMRRLIEVVWHKIMSLDLPDTRHYSADFTGVLAFENDLLDGNI